MKAWSGVVVVGIIAVLIVFAVPVASGATRPAPAKELKVAVGDLAGVVTDSTGKALPDVALKLMLGDKVISKVSSDKKGEYLFKKLTAGEFKLIVGGEGALCFAASKEGKTKSLQLVVPARKDYSSAALNTSILTKNQWIWVGVGTGVALAVATPILASEGDWFGGGSSSTVSP